MTLELNDQEHRYLLELLMQRPVQEALPLFLKLSNQQLAPNQPPQPPSLKAAS